MTMLPIADFLAGALLTLLLPVVLLIALVAWYWMVSVRTPDTPDRRESSASPAAATPGPTVSETLPPEPGA